MPGISRSGATIATSVLLGVDKESAAKFSFLMVVPLIFGKMAKDILSGDIQYESFIDGVVTLSMKGACSGCPSSTATLKMGIENMLKHYIPDVKEVKARAL